VLHNYKEDDNFTEDMPFGEFLRKKRRLMGYNQTDMAELFGVSQWIWSKWELGDYSPPFNKALEIVKSLGGTVKIVNIKKASYEDINPSHSFGYNPWQE